MLTKEKYANYKTWNEHFEDGIVDLENIKHHESWDEMFDEIFSQDEYKTTCKELEKTMKKTDDIYPFPRLLFNAFKLTSYDDLKVVILGQDPYFDSCMNDDIKVPQAMGLSFSVPIDFQVPSSLKNIYKNLLNNGHIKKIPNHGNLESWAKSGVLLLNTSLTVIQGSTNKNCHQHIWSWMTDYIIKYIAKNKKNVVFVLWGSDALKKSEFIDIKKNKIIVSSHPSGLSASKPLKIYPAFNDYDHFGIINKYLDEKGVGMIDWNLDQ